jgi:hypothetical protein
VFWVSLLAADATPPHAFYGIEWRPPHHRLGSSPADVI